MTGLQLHARACGPLQVVSLLGQLDLTEADDTAATLTSLAAGGRRVIADLAALEFIDCYALRALAQARDQARQQGGDILLAAPPPIVTQMLELTGLGAALAVHASVTAAAGRQDRLEKLLSRGIFLREAGRFDEAIGAHQAAVHTARQADDQPGETVALVSLGFTLREAGRLDEAIGAHQAAVHTARQAGDRQTEADALGSLGIFLREAGRVAEAICAHRAAAITARETGDPQIEAEALYDLGISQREAGRVDEAICAHQTAVGLPPETGARLAADNMPITDAPEVGALNSVGSTQHRTLRAALAGMDLMLCAAQSVTQGQQAAGELATDYTSGTLDRATFQAAVNRVIALRESLK